MFSLWTIHRMPSIGRPEYTIAIEFDSVEPTDVDGADAAIKFLGRAQSDNGIAVSLKGLSAVLPLGAHLVQGRRS